MTHFRNLPAVVLSGRCFPRAAILAVLLVAAVLVPGGNAHAQTVSNFTCNQNGIDSVQICWYISGTNCSWPLTWPGATIYVDNVPISSTGSSSGCITYSGLVPGFHSFKIRAEKCYSNSNPAYGYCSQLVSCSPPNVSCSLPSIDTAQINIFNQQAYPSVDIIMTPPSGGPVVVYSGPPITVYWVTLQEPGVHEFSVVAGVLSGPPCPSVSCTVQAVFPEVCNNGIDDDLDSLIDCADPDCAADPACGCWPETQQMTPGLGSLYVFAGMSVSVSGDVMVVGIADDDGMTEGGAAYIYLLDPQTGQWIQFQQLQDPNGTPVDHFGYSVSVSGDVIVIGEPGDGLLDTGRAFVYERDPQSGLWLEVDQLTASSPFSGNTFGASVSVSGDVLVVGAFDYFNGSNQGSVYLFERDINGAWLQTQELSDLGGGGLGSGYGSSVSIMDDVIVVGQPYDDVQGNSSGSVLVYELDNMGFWQETQKLLKPGGTTGDRFGKSVDICDDVIAIGVPGDADQGPDSGSAFVFERDYAGIWQPTPLPLPSGGAPVDHFGSAVSISANTIVIGSQWDDDQGPNSGSAFVYQRDTLTGPWLETEKLLASDGAQDFWFGSAVSISGETIAVAGGYYFLNGGGPSWPIGRAYIYTLDPTCQLPSLEVCDNGIDDDCDGWIDCEDPDCAGFSVWQPPEQLLDPNGTALDGFGNSVAVSGDTIVVGSVFDADQGYDSGSAFVFERVGGVWQPPVQLLDPNGAAGDWFGISVAVSGDTIVVGSSFADGQGFDSGSAFVFERVGGVWQPPEQLLDPNGAAGDWFGYSVAVSGDTIVVGSRNDADQGFQSGSAFVFERVGGVWQPPVQLLDPNGAAGDWFGISVAVSGDTIVVGSPSDDDQGYGSGSAFVFERVGGVWQPPEQLLDPNGAPGDGFGWSVAVSGDTIVVGSSFADGQGFDSGSAFVFERVGGVWQPPVQLLDPNGAPGDGFGWSVAVSGDTIVVGSRNDDDQGFQSGSAFAFKRVGGVWQPPVQLLDPNGAAEDWFGFSVAVSGDTIVVGSLHDDDQGTNSGSAFVFEQPLCPTAGEICGNGIDDDNDGLIDCDDTNCIGEINCIGNGFVFIAPVIDVNYPENTGEASFDVRLSIREDPTSAGFPSETQAFSMALIYDRDLIEATSIELSDILLETLGVPPVFFQVDASAGSLTASVVFDGTIQFDDEIAVLNVGFQTNPEVIAGSSGSSVRSLVWADSAALANLVIVSGEPIAPQFIDGAVALHPVSGQPPISTGDPNGDGSIDISDTITLLSYLFSAAAINCVAAGDVNGDNQVDVADPIFLLTFIFAGGPPPVGGTECTPDPTPADPPLECESSGCP